MVQNIWNITNLKEKVILIQGKEITAEVQTYYTSNGKVCDTPVKIKKKIVWYLVAIT
jgi:hypothetical protein